MANQAGRAAKDEFQAAKDDFQDAAEDVKTNAKQNINTADLEADIRQLREDVAKLTDQLAKTGAQSYGTARRAAAEGVEHLKASGGAAIDSLKDNAHQLEDQLAEKVREKPITSIALAAAFGYFFAVLRR